MKTCPFCAESVQDAAVICKHCQRRLDGTRDVVKVRQADFISTIAKWSVGTLALLMMFGVILPACGIY